MTCRRELTMLAVLAAFEAELQTTFGASTRALRQLPPENTANVTDAVTGFFLELEGSEIVTADNSPKALYKKAPVLFLGLFKCGADEEATLWAQANEFEAAVERLIATAITADGAVVHVHPGGAYGRAVGKGQMWVEVPAEILIRQKP